MGATRTTIVLALSTIAAGAFDEALTRTPAPTRRLSLTRAPVEWLVGASVASQPVHGFRSEVAGPAPGELARIDVEGSPSPLSDSSLIRVAVQVRRTGPGGVALRNGWARVSFFSSEVAQWQRTGQPIWQPADEPAEFVFDDLSRGDTRMVFFHVDALQRFGSGIGVVEVGGIDVLTGEEVRLHAPLARHAFHRSLDHASTDFRFFAAVCLAPLTSSLVVADLLADSAIGIPERETFAATVQPRLLREDDRGFFFNRRRDEDY
jgi:hypothetical protein